MGLPLGVAAVLGPGGILAQAIPGWEPRPSQLEMAEAVADALGRRRPLLVEAGTGTGKTLAYLVPALLSGLKVVVSTGTKNLQEQILKKDVPLLAEHLPIAFTATGLKGISNYLCRRRHGEFVAMHKVRLALGQAEEDDAVAALEAWAERTGSGDRAELPDLSDESPLWREVSSTTETRLGPRCRHFEECFVTQARRRAQTADLVIVNHHLFFADLALREKWPMAQLLPAYEAVIFDEAHQLEDVITDYFGISVSTARLARLARDLRYVAGAGHLDPRAEAVAAHVEGLADTLFSALRPRLPRDGRVAASDEIWGKEAIRAWLDLDNALVEAEGVAGSAAADTREAQEACAALARRSREIRDDLAVVADRADRRKVYWIETRGRAVFLHGSPVEVAEIVREKLLAQVEATVFTSATLAASGSFDYVRARLGLAAASEARLGSPFDYARQALLYLPRDLPEPADADFTARVADRMGALVEASAGRAFLLFTSHRQMQAVHALLAPRFARAGLPVLLQGERPKHLLLEAFRERPTVLLATASFWEGVDVVGEALQLVVIDKLPFAPPDDPLLSARLRRVEEEGGDGFATLQLPAAALALAQGFGRLIRHRKDRGVVAILDRRAVTRGYGRRVLSSLPAECPRTGDLEVVRAFFRALRGQPEGARPRLDPGDPGIL